MSTFWKDTADFLLTGMGSDLFDKAGNLISAISPLFSIGFGIYILIVVMNAYNRGFDGNVVDLSKRAMGWLIIISCAFNAAQYSKIANIAYNMPEQLAAVFGNGDYNLSVLDTAWDNIMTAVAHIEEKAAELDFTEVSDKLMLHLGAGILVSCGVIFFAIITAFYLVAKLSLAMVIVIGPLFLGFMLFPATRQYAMNWIGQSLNYIVTIAFFTILSSLQMKFFQGYLEKALAEDFDSVAQVIGIIPVFLAATVFFVIVAWNIPSIASALTGGASVGGLSNFARTFSSLNKNTTPKEKGGGGKIKVQK